MRDFLQKWKLQSWKQSNFARLSPFWSCWLHNLRLRTIALGDFPSEVLKVLRLPRKIEAESSEVLYLPREMIFKNSKNPKFKNATSLITKRRKRWFLLRFAMCRFPFAFHAKRSAQGCGKSLAFKGNVCWLQLVVWGPQELKKSRYAAPPITILARGGKISIEIFTP